MQKKLIVIFLSLVLVFQHSFSFVLAQSSTTSDQQFPPACSAPPPMMLQYQQFQNEMASALLGGAFGERRFEADINVMGWFTSKVLHLPTAENSVVDTVFSALWDNTRRLAQATLTTTFLLELAAMSVVGSNLGGFAILFEDRAVVRDWKTLLQIETKISQIAYYLGKTANITASLENLGSLQALVVKYQEAGLFTGVASSSSASYADILADLSSMNAAMKFLVATNQTRALRNYQATSLFQVQFSPEVYGTSGLQADYRPVRKFSACNAFWGPLTSGVKNAVGEGTSAASEAWDIIKNAAERLAKAGKNFAPRLGGNGIAEKSFTTEELQQLRTIYGVDTSKMTVISVSWWKRILTPLGSLKKTWNDVKKQVSPLIADVKNVIHDVQEVLNDYKKSKQQRQEEKEKNEQEKENAKFLVEEKVMLSDRERESILGDLGVVYNSNFENDLYFAYADSFDYVTEVYNQMAQNTLARDYSAELTLFNTIITKIKEIEAGVVTAWLKIMGDICEYQCKNTGNKGCRI